jgi:hypothetical protein
MLHLVGLEMIDCGCDTSAAELGHELGGLFNRFAAVVLGPCLARRATCANDCGTSLAQRGSDATSCSSRRSRNDSHAPAQCISIWGPLQNSNLPTRHVPVAPRFNTLGNTCALYVVKRVTAWVRRKTSPCGFGRDVRPLSCDRRHGVHGVYSSVGRLAANARSDARRGAAVCRSRIIGDVQAENPMTIARVLPILMIPPDQTTRQKIKGR